MPRWAPYYGRGRLLSPPLTNTDEESTTHDSTNDDELPAPDYSRLECAAKRGDLETVRTIMEPEQLPNSAIDKIDDEALTYVMHSALFRGYGDIAEYLLKEHKVKFGTVHVGMATKPHLRWLLPLFIERGWDANKPMHPRQLPLLADVVEDLDLVKWLIQQGADPNARAVYDQTPLSFAVSRGSIACIEYLFNHGGSIEKGELLHNAAQRTLLDCEAVGQILLDRGCRIDAICYANDPVSWKRFSCYSLGTPLHKAVKIGNTRMVRFFLEHGADPWIRDSLGCSTVKMAGYLKNEEIIRLFEPYLADPYAEDTTQSLISASQTDLPIVNTLHPSIGLPQTDWKAS